MIKSKVVDIGTTASIRLLQKVIFKHCIVAFTRKKKKTVELILIYGMGNPVAIF